MDVLSLVVNDFYGHGKPDVAFASASGQAVGVFSNNGDGTLDPTPRLSPTAFAEGSSNPLASGDFDGDGKLDLAMVASFGRVTVLYGKGDGTFGPPSSYAFPTSTWAVAVGDFNGDNAPDLAVGPADGTVAILLNGVGRGGGGGGGPGGGGSAPQQPRTALPDLGVAGLVALRSNGGAGTLAALPPISPAADVRSLASGAPEVAAVDGFFAVVGRQASGLAMARRRLRTVPLLDEVPPLEAGIEDYAEAGEVLGAR
jgi:hypothetical protein